MKNLRWVALGGVALALVACGGSNEEAKSADPYPTVTPPPPMDPAPPPPPVSTAPAEATPAAADAPATPPTPAVTLTDAQIAMLTDTANTGEIEQAKLAQKKGKNPKVKKFAAMMIAHHSEAKQKQAKLLAKLKVTPEATPKSEAMATEDKQSLEALKGLGAGEFDSVYIAGQVDAHQKVLDTFDTQLIPSAKDPEFKASLVEFRPKVEAHLKEAKAINDEISGGKVATPVPASGPAATGPVPAPMKPMK